MIRFILILFLFLFVPTVVFAQTGEGAFNNKGNYLDTNFRNILIIKEKVHFGGIINNYMSFENYPKRKMSFTNEFYLGVKTRGNKNWHKQYKFPEIGASLILGNLGNPNELGNVFGIVPNMNIEISRNNKSIFRTIIGIGAGYFNKPFDSISNPYNILIGSHFTNLSFFSLAWDYKLSQNMQLVASANIFHASNGHYQIPNAGMNMPTLNFGIKYYMNNNYEKVDEIANNLYKKKNIFKLNFMFGAGMHEFANTIAPVGTPKWKIYSGTLFASYRKNNIYKYFTGFSAKYYSSFYDFITRTKYYDNNIHLKSTVFTFVGGHEFLFGHFGLSTQMGYNFYTPLTVKRFKANNHVEKISFDKAIEIYTSFDMGLKYYLYETNYWTKSNLFLGITIKTNFFKADFIELSMGFVI